MSGFTEVKLDPDEIVARAHETRYKDRYNEIVARFCLFSGGSDSSVVAHRCRDAYDELVHIDTGTAIPGVQDFAREFADWLGKPLIVLQTPWQEYRRLVIGSQTPRAGGKPDIALGFPGPANHGTCYTRLKQRRINELMRTRKKAWSHGQRILLISGLRRAESWRRKNRPEITVTSKDPGIWCNPLIDWTAADMHDYREQEMADAPRSEIAALLHRSGECNCGAFAPPGERELLQALFPQWWAETMGALEEEAAQAGLRVAKWGQGKLPKTPLPDSAPMCSDCQLVFEL